MNTTDIIAISAILVTILVNAFQIKQNTKQLKLQFFSEYTSRYQNILLNLPVNIFSEEFQIKKLNPEDQQSMYKYLRMYFDLCSEEFYLSREKKVAQKVWKEWEQGILYNFKIKHINEALIHCGIRPEFYTDFVSYLKKNKINI